MSDKFWYFSVKFYSLDYELESYYALKNEKARKIGLFHIIEFNLFVI